MLCVFIVPGKDQADKEWGGGAAGAPEIIPVPQLLFFNCWKFVYEVTFTPAALPLSSFHSLHFWSEINKFGAALYCSTVASTSSILQHAAPTPTQEFQGPKCYPGNVTANACVKTRKQITLLSLNRRSSVRAIFYRHRREPRLLKAAQSHTWELPSEKLSNFGTPPPRCGPQWEQRHFSKVVSHLNRQTEGAGNPLLIQTNTQAEGIFAVCKCVYKYFL